MRITGTLHGIDTYEKTSDLTRDGEVVGTTVNYHRGLLITADEETLRAASNLLCATVDIYPHPVNGLVAGECTPENYAHALARLAHTEDHLAREVRSSQALAAALETAQARISLAVDVLATAYYTDGAHHKQWVADQALRALLGDRYDAWAEKQVGCVANNRELTGIAP